MTSGRATSSRTSPSIPANGRLYAVWQDASFDNNQADAIAFSQSLDGGLTWSTPIKVNQTPTSIPIGDQQAFTPVRRRVGERNRRGHLLRLPQQHRRAATANRLLHRALPSDNGHGLHEHQQLGQRSDADRPVVRHAPGPRCRRLLHRRLRGPRQRRQRLHSRSCHSHTTATQRARSSGEPARQGYSRAGTVDASRPQRASHR